MRLGEAERKDGAADKNESNNSISYPEHLFVGFDKAKSVGGEDLAAVSLKK